MQEDFHCTSPRPRPVPAHARTRTRTLSRANACTREGKLKPKDGQSKPEPLSPSDSSASLTLALALALAWAAAGPGAAPFGSAGGPFGGNSTAFFLMPIPTSLTTRSCRTGEGVLALGFVRPPLTCVSLSASPTVPRGEWERLRDLSRFSLCAMAKPGKRIAMDSFRAASIRSFFARASICSGVSLGSTISVFCSFSALRALPVDALA
mmetsp:Transcript_136267/g.436004  ORF Transcript_136267/g.436004 Transcript_136267/m.436004 type:complete len:208 (-) Transcript_136267:3617-4240(-)